jgi:hypothetical protein
VRGKICCGFWFEAFHPMRVACHHAGFVSSLGTTAIGFVHGHGQKRFGSQARNLKDKSVPQGSWTDQLIEPIASRQAKTSRLYHFITRVERYFWDAPGQP